MQSQLNNLIGGFNFKKGFSLGIIIPNMVEDLKKYLYKTTSFPPTSKDS
jgi:hypothetical protein